MAILVVCVSALAVTLATRGPAHVSLTPADAPDGDDHADRAERPVRTTVKLITLNLAHGRKDGWHQALQSGATIRSNLDEVAECLRRQQPDVVALQEADGPSLWSGGFDHVAHLAETAGCAHHVRGEHVKGMKLSYGTALLSRQPLTDSASTTFAPSPPTFAKGFVVGTVAWPGKPEMQFDVISVHLDFARGSVRKDQVQRLVEELSQRNRPRIILGDFNCQWEEADGPLRMLAGQLDLCPCRPDATDLPTFPTSQKRLDWVLASPQFEFVEYQTLSETLSDHRAVVAVLKLADADVP
jgi:endonuclease/exonuclease/phosphatase family metal-dependent hydrolase